MTKTRETKNGSRVRVGVRVRPLSSHELKDRGSYSLNLDPSTVHMGQRKFTYDAVFDENYCQAELYESVSTRLLSSFIDGYNATIMAYGQTGSGKTFTMGSEAHVEPEASSRVGLIPRFITDFFLELQRKKAASDKEVDGNQILLDYSLKTSFLEVYGEDVYDLLDANRCSLPLRENSKGGIVVVGLVNRSISNTLEALQVLHEGTMNRTTAATLMNRTSSRSHAVFTIHLSQVIRTIGTDGCDMTTASQFTFVDLAGSERMKKTGAEGERAREGIKINEGLLALGNVINALADEGNMKKAKKVYVPYRQSKLTRLLQDALGGNSQTLFLACVSPSITNSSETLSTLKYANRARNIRNEPTKNVDGASAELERLKNINRILQFELIKSRFQVSQQGAEDQNEIGKIDESLLHRDDIAVYIQQIYMAASEDMISHNILRSSVPLLIASKNLIENDDSTTSMRRVPKNRNRSSDKFDVSLLEDINPDEEMAILDHLLELQQHDHEYEKSREQDNKDLKQMSGELEKQEILLLQLRESLKVYHGLKGKYELLMEDLHQLENEKSNLAKLLDQSKIDPLDSSSLAIRKRLEKVEINLSRARRETLDHRQKQRFAENQARKCKILERKVNELKNTKSSLMKKQKQDAVRYKKTTEAKTNELLSLKRRAKITDKRMSKLENELNLQKKNYSKQTHYCSKLSEKLKNTEKYLVNLLAIRQSNLSENRLLRKHQLVRQGGRNIAKSESAMRSLSEEEIKATKYIFDRMVSDKVKKRILKKKYEEAVAAYSETMRKVLSEGKALKNVQARINGDHNQSLDNRVLIKDLEDNIVNFELKLELIESELQELSAQLPNSTISSEKDIEDAVRKLLTRMSPSVLKSTLLETFSKFVQVETEHQIATDLLEQKEAALIGIESELDSLNCKLKCLSKELVDRKALDEMGNDKFLTIKHLTDERNQYKNDLSIAHRNIECSNKMIHQLKTSLSAAQTEMMESNESLALVKATFKKEGEEVEVNKTIARLQQIWEELGADSLLRKEAQKQIEFCLEDTCAKLLDDATTMKFSIEKDVSVLSSKLERMKAALGVPIEEICGSSKRNLNRSLAEIQDQLRNLEVPYRFAAARRRKIVEDVIVLTGVLGFPLSKLHNDLQILLQDEIPTMNEKSWSKNSAVDAEIDHFSIFRAQCLETEFLTRCEDHISKLRVAKSEMMLETRELQQKISVLLGKMRLNESQSLTLIGEWIKRNRSNSPDWWDSKFASDMLQDVGQMKFLSSTSKNSLQHLELMNKALSTSAQYRRSISKTLKSVIKHIQKTLLDIVGREMDASEACAGFNDALFRMPPLSTDLILSCIFELEALMDGIEAMAKTEIEALIVVWEALKVSEKEQRNFWDSLEKSSIRQDNQNPFSEVHFQVSSFHEKWMVDAVKSSRDSYETMMVKLSKLEGINKEVEKLRSKQDLKSQILSLDSQIRIMNAKLIDFEELQCNKQRLLTKKIGGTTLLREERFRKQMQSKFLSNLKQLVSLLRSWERKGNGRFDNSLLSDDVRELLKEDTDQMENWVDMRTKLMRLRTVKAPVLKSKSNQSPHQYVERVNSRHDSGITPPQKRTAASIPKNTVSTRFLNVKNDKKMIDSTTLTHSWDNPDGRNLKKRKRKQDSITLPFGSILADSPKQFSGYI